MNETERFGNVAGGKLEIQAEAPEITSEVLENQAEEPETTTEVENKPKYRFMVTRHADRSPDGKLTPDGIEKSSVKGASMKDEVEVVKGYSSDDKTNRTYDTSELISDASETIANTDEQYKTRKVKDIQYNILDPDMSDLLAKAKEAIDKATLVDLGLSTEKGENGKFLIDLAKLPKEEQIKVGPVRQKNQILGFRYMIDNDKATHRMAMGLAHQLTHEFAIAGRYDKMRDYKDDKLEKDAVLNAVTHGLFSESLLKEAGVFKNKDGELMEGIKDFESEEFGGYFGPADSFYIEVQDPNNLPELLPIVFEGGNRPENGRVFIRLEKLKSLTTDYDKFFEERKKYEEERKKL